MTQGRSRLAKRFALGVLGALLLLLAIAVARALAVDSLQVTSPAAAPIAVEADKAVARLSRAIQFQTVSHQDRATDDPTAFTALHGFLRESFPRTFQALKSEPFEGRSLLLTWPGSDPSLPAALLMAHTDVVPVEPDTESRWTHPPFSGAIVDGRIWGRGARDDKGSALAILEATEHLLSSGFTPKRTLILFFGGDEEVLGIGAPALAKHLLDRRIPIEFVLDEGLLVTVGMAPGAKRPVAMIGIAEKGFVSIELVAAATGGHSSMPPPNTAAGLIARAVTRLEDDPFPPTLSGPAGEMLRFLAPEVGFGLRLVFTNRWLFGPVLLSQFTGKNETNALVRTTTAATQLEGSVKDNVLPATARAVVNFRLLPGMTVEALVAAVKEKIADDRVEVRPIGRPTNPSPVAPVDTAAFKTIQRTIAETLGDVLVAPSLVIGATDSRHLAPVTPAVYRFVPFRADREDVKGIHGTNENLPVEEYVRGIQFYAQLIRNAAQ